MPRMLGSKRSQIIKVAGCPPLRGREGRWLQEPQRTRRKHQRVGTISCMVAMAISHMADGVDPMEVDPPKDQE